MGKGSNIEEKGTKVSECLWIVILGGILLNLQKAILG
jgi:hypothetical protein